MGAFFLFRSAAGIETAAVRRIFRAKGFAEPRVHECGAFTLWHFRKQLLDEDNFFRDEEGDGIYATGTVVYQGAGYGQSLRRILEDFKLQRLQRSELKGHYCLWISRGSRLSVLVDPLGVHHVFADGAGTRFSSSFLAVLASLSGKQQVNTHAFLEKFCAGYILGPDTLVNGISRLTPRAPGSFFGEGIEFMSPEAPTSVSFPARMTFHECLERQHALLNQYFSQIGPLARSYGVDLGLSAGYDSRLLLAHLTGCRAPFSVHTHHTRTREADHEKYLPLVRSLAKDAGADLRVCDTLPMEALDEETRARDLLEGLYFYDARCGDNSGAFHPTYTRRYKALTYDKHRLRLNGEGGEIYRNYFVSSPRKVQLGSWLRNRVYFNYATQCLRSKTAWHDLERMILAKLSQRLEADCLGQLDWRITRRFYGEVWLPECEGVLANADAQLAHFLMPFAEDQLIHQAYECTPFIGVGGQFEAALITKANPALAARPSHYGFPLHRREPLGFRLAQSAKALAPDRLHWWWKADRPVARRSAQAELASYRTLRDKSKIVRESEEALRAFLPEVEPDVLMSIGGCRRTAVFLGCFLREFASCLSRS